MADKKYKNKLLLGASILFYSWGEPRFFFTILLTTLIDFYLVHKIYNSSRNNQRKLLLVISLSINLGLLFYYKYCGFFVENVSALISAAGFKEIKWVELALPIGISFYTFETITYVVDVYRKIHKPLDSFLDYLLYILLFPKLVAGPIIRYHEIADQITDRTNNDTVDLKLSGFYRFCIGLAKKVLIANSLSQYYVDDIFHTNPGLLSTSTAWIGLLGFTFQIYFDFSGYCDIAIGIGNMLGFKFPENFNNPYLSISISDFWRRWHITLGNWMKNYLYIPLGGNRVSLQRMYFNLCLVFILSGLWHKASWNFVVWGCFHGLFIISDRLFLDSMTKNWHRVFKILLTFFITTIGWLIFASMDLRFLARYFTVLMGFDNNQPFKMPELEFCLSLGVALFFSFIGYFNFWQHLQQKIYFEKLRNRYHMLFCFISLVLFFISLSYVTTSGFSPFIYFRF